jgi:hypothetical protein
VRLMFNVGLYDWEGVSLCNFEWNFIPRFFESVMGLCEAYGGLVLPIHGFPYFKLGCDRVALENRNHHT